MKSGVLGWVLQESCTWGKKRRPRANELRAGRRWRGETRRRSPGRRRADLLADLRPATGGTGARDAVEVALAGGGAAAAASVWSENPIRGGAGGAFPADFPSSETRGAIMTTFHTRIFSPRWGHEDTYTVDFTQEAMDIRLDHRGARCVWRENLDPEWQGQPLLLLLSNDHIAAPAVFPRMLEYLWQRWRVQELTDQEAGAELQLAVEWLNAVTLAKPRSEFWRGFF